MCVYYACRSYYYNILFMLYYLFACCMPLVHTQAVLNR